MSEALSFSELESTAKPATATAAQVTTEEKPKTETASAAIVEETKPQFTEADVEAYRQLVDMGITPQNAQEFKQAKLAMDNLPALMRQNPDALLDEIQKNDPTLHDDFMERVSDRWYNQKGKKLAEQMQDQGNGSRVTKSEHASDPRVETLAREVATLKAENAQAKAAVEGDRIFKGYNKALDDLEAKLPESVPADKREHIRLKAEKLAWQDPKARENINKGNFTDVPKYFAKAASSVTAETKAAADKEHEARKGVESRGAREIVPAAENVNGEAKRSGPGEDPIWGDITSTEIKAAYK